MLNWYADLCIIFLQKCAGWFLKFKANYILYIKFTGVKPEMFLEGPLFRKFPAAVGASKRFLSTMSSDMTLPRITVQESFRTNITLPWTLTHMSFHMKFVLEKEK